MKIRTGFVSNSSTSSFILIGLKIDRNKLYVQELKDSCDCNIEDKDKLAFCSKCGTKVRKISREAPIPEYNHEDCVEYPQIGKFDIQEDEEGNAFAMIPNTYKSGGEYTTEKLNIVDDLESLKQEMKETFEKLELWNEEKFGIWFGSRYC